MTSHVKAFPLIGLAGRARTGKTTVADRLTAEYGYSNLSFAAPIREFVAQLTGITLAELENTEVKEAVILWIGKSPRQLMQTLGTEWGRQLVREDFWVRRALAAAETIPGGRAVISDVRFDNEAEAIRAAGGVVLHIVRPDALEVSSHPSEAGVARDPRDFIIFNDLSLSALHKEVEHFLYGLWRRAEKADTALLESFRA
ncbi:deoxynucleotide monophosphate kinase family protein [Xylophilus sp.]|uniref:deoxynucleotide monophosphate kinase family protein n=1 Tax=Xylophilus sp. TaxID=2653893 RepID=UPI0013B88DCE|nr:deoxynucleotide monophosphate kinase [Xylophilus sp.]KAF1049339.1 MAG: hypothetical protein GAK38_00795 [Xylophilus sp.]